MAKQSFSVGQVLTAAQMTSLQQTAMLGGSATAKTTSYTLVAADAGTVVSVNSTSATTITVNTGLFAAGDTVTIQNWGTGSVTITAGTATVNTAGSLIVPQYDGGVLYFTSASAAIYFDFVQAGAVSPLTTKGDLYGFGSSDARIPIGANNTVLTADSNETLGLKWATPAAGGMTSIASGSIAAATTGIDISSIPNTYNELVLYITNASTASAANIAIRVNNNSSADYSRMYYSQLSSSVIQTSSGATSLIYVDNFSATQAGQTAIISFPNYKNTSGMKLIESLASYTNEYMFFTSGLVKATAAIDRIQIISSSTFDGGTYELFGVK